ncbi:MAG: sigma-54 interaction domain-containing protein, partial [bacterium]
MNQNSGNGQANGSCPQTEQQKIPAIPGKQLDFLDDQLGTLETELRSRYRFDFIVGHHPKMVMNLKLVSQIADTDATVLIHGESGTGKELIARALHYNSKRQYNPFVTINCGALPESLLESELFGHVRGSFTGAIKDKPGWFECAHGGTIFLDEVSEMTPALQVKLLRILQTGDYSPVGSTETRKCDVRFVAATNKDLPALVHEGKFREDLYFRLNVIDIEVPPLRERKSDIAFLSEYFMSLYGAKYGKEKVQMAQETEQRLFSYDFPGNVRELENIIQRCVLLAENN